MITSRKAVYNGQTITVYSGLRSDALPTYAQENDRFRNLDDDITYIFTENGWAELVEGGGGSNPILENAIRNHGIGYVDPDVTIEWDGITEGKDTLGNMYKVSDEVFTLEELKSSEVTIKIEFRGNIIESSVDPDDIMFFETGGARVIAIEEYVMVLLDDIHEETESGLVDASKGIYFDIEDSIITKKLHVKSTNKIEEGMVAPAYPKITSLKCYSEESMDPSTVIDNYKILFDGIKLYVYMGYSETSSYPKTFYFDISEIKSRLASLYVRNEFNQMRDIYFVTPDGQAVYGTIDYDNCVSEINIGELQIALGVYDIILWHKPL